MALQFGTSGLRGLAVEMNDSECYSAAFGFLAYLMEKGVLSKGMPVALAGDLRSSTPRILLAVSQAVIDIGCQAENLGFIPTPALFNYAKHRNMPSMMVTGSHIPDDRNGIKFHMPDREVLKEDESRIIELSRLSYRQCPPAMRLKPSAGIAETEYVERYMRFFPKDCLRGKRIVLYQHSSLQKDLLLRILKMSGADVIPVGDSNRFTALDTESVQALHVKRLKAWIKQYWPYAAVSTDGDGDRPLLFDEAGCQVRGDILGIMCAKYLRADFVAIPISCNTSVDYIGFPNVVKTKIGSPYVISAMNTAIKGGAARAIAYEANGGFITGTDIDIEGRTLPALPTRDAILPLMTALLFSHQPMSLSAGSVRIRHNSCTTITDLPKEKALKMVQALQSEERLRKLFGMSGTLDCTDGTRVTFENNDILHIRPSGNAPELRVYLETQSPEMLHELEHKIPKFIQGLLS